MMSPGTAFFSAVSKASLKSLPQSAAGNASPMAAAIPGAAFAEKRGELDPVRLGGERRKIHSFVQTAEQYYDVGASRIGQAVQRGDHRGRIGRLGVVDEGDAVPGPPRFPAGGGRARRFRRPG